MPRVRHRGPKPQAAWIAPSAQQPSKRGRDGHIRLKLTKGGSRRPIGGALTLGASWFHATSRSAAFARQAWLFPALLRKSLAEWMCWTGGSASGLVGPRGRFLPPPKSRRKGSQDHRLRLMTAEGTDAVRLVDAAKGACRPGPGLPSDRQRGAPRSNAGL